MRFVLEVKGNPFAEPFYISCETKERVDALVSTFAERGLEAKLLLIAKAKKRKTR